MTKGKLPRRRDRIGKRTLTVHTEEEIFRHFQRLKADRLASTDEMMHEALELLFERYNELGSLLRKMAVSAKLDPQQGDEEALS
jgi:hypothetical protein